ncbi:hypothetical protein QQ045_015913 [Rhodiola kirilowii]
MGSKQAPDWADQWAAAAGGSYNDAYEYNQVEEKKKNNKMEAAKAAASVGVEKAKAGAVIGAQKVKSGTSGGFKWLKNQYTKKMSK